MDEHPELDPPRPSVGEVIPDPTPLEVERPKPRLWGPWATLGWSLLCLLVMLIGQFFASVVYIVVRAATHARVDPASLQKDGNLLALASVISTPPTVGLVLLLVALRGVPLREGLALLWPRTREVAPALGVFLVLLVAIDLVNYLAGRPISPEVIVDVYRSAWLPALLLALLVAAPVGEEVLFRGFLCRGLAASRWGWFPAAVLSSALWAIIHLQYDLFGIATIFLMGLYLALVLRRTGSVLLTMVLHFVANAFSLLEIYVQLNWLNP